ncbi:MAG: OmpA family protein [Oligoflexia bacterium]|nr:OmpA family protein [Oligoflexia bacterium]
MNLYHFYLNHPLYTFFGGYKFDGAQNYRTRPIYGLRLGSELNPRIGLEIVGAYIRSRYRDEGDTELQRNIFRYSLDGIYRFGILGQQNPVVPFFALGLGGITFKGRSGGDDHSRWQANYGLGVMMFMTDRFSLRGDLRHLVLIDHNHYSNFEGSVGVAFLFGNESRASAVSDQNNKTETPSPAPTQTSPKPLPAQLPAESPAVKKEEATNIILKDVHFAFQSSKLTQNGTEILDRVIQNLKDNPDMSLRIEGKTSASGTKKYNQKLSERRANAVKTYLLSEGSIDPNRLKTIGYGKARPAVFEPHPSNKYSKAAKANMRAHFVILINTETL